MRTPIVVVGAGHLGRALLHALRERGVAGRALVRTAGSRDALRRAGFEAEAVDLADTDRLRRAVSEAEQVVFSAAPGPGGDPRTVYDEGMRSLLGALRSRPLARVLYIGSTGVYAERGGGWVDEEAPFGMGTPRIDALVAAERHLLRAAASGRIRAAALRCSGLVDVDRGPQMRLPALAGRERADGEAWLNLVSVEDVVRIATIVLEHTWSGVVNVSGPRPMRRRAFYDPLLERAGLEPIRWQQDEAGERGYRVRVERLFRELGVRPRRIDPWTLPLPSR